MPKNFGGNAVAQWRLEKASTVFADGPYYYALFSLAANQQWTLPETLESATVYALESPESLLIDGVKTELAEGDALQLEQMTLSLSTQSHPAKILVAGVSEPVEEQGFSITTRPNLKKIDKPWGHELWINGEHPGYALKQIFIRGPHKTSLQYHQFKEETNILFEGEAKLHYKANDEVENDTVQAGDISTLDLAPISSVSVVPEVLHRIEAVTDVLLYEVSTPHLDDVIRVSDDSKRPDGRIDTEHKLHERAR